jgi:putative phosphoesterase
MRIAILSDIHGNLTSLEAVLADVEAERPDQIVCLGDVALFGPQPGPVIERLQALDPPVVMGNGEEWLVGPGEPSQPDDEHARRIEAISFWCLEQLTAADLDYLRTFRPTVAVALGGDAGLLCFHGSPRSCRDVILSTTPDEELEPMLSGFDATLMAGGHTHAQMVRRYRGQTLINPGSVGLPIERLPSVDRNPPWAEYALVSWQNGSLGVELRRVPIDVNRVVEAALNSGMPHAEWWTKDWG